VLIRARFGICRALIDVQKKYQHCFKETNKMKIKNGYIIIGLVIALAFFFELAAHADEVDHATVITFTQPIQIPGKVLPRGSYLFKLTDTESTQHAVQIFSADQAVAYGTFLTNVAELREPANDTELTLAEPEAGGPRVLLKWFYPGSDFGNEFVYSKQAEKQLAQDRQEIILANQAPVSNSENTGAGN
jgi:hypothetical protein